MHTRLAAALLVVLCAGGISRGTEMTADGSQPLAAWLDQVWVDHLNARAAAATNTPMMQEAFLRDALRADPDHVPTLAALAGYYRAAGMVPLDAALDAYGRRLDPAHRAWVGEYVVPEDGLPWSDDHEARYRNAAAWFAAGDYIDAEIELRRLLIDHPGDRRLLVDLGLLYLQTRDWGMAASVFALANDRFPGDRDIANNLAVCLDQVGRPGLVPAVLLPLLAAQPDDAYLLQNIARYALAGGDADTARTHAERWLAVEPDNPEAQVFLAARWLTDNRQIEALELLDRCLGAQPERLDAWMLKAEVYIALGKLSEARTALSELARLMPRDQFLALVELSPFDRIVDAARLATELPPEVKP